MTELVFKGKEFVFNHHLTVPFRPLETHAAKGVGAPSFDGNLIIHGDNLHGLKALLPTHAGKVDCIFIDPPYNTGNEGWCYNDNVNSPMIKEWLNDNPIGIEDGLRHDKWCAMMWPRLRLLHELLHDEGTIWITLDDNEINRARGMLDEIFGENSFVCQIVTQSNKRGQTYKAIAKTHEYILVYGKTEYSVLHELETEGSNLPERDSFGSFSARELRNRNPKFGRHNRPNLYYPFYARKDFKDGDGNNIASVVKFKGAEEVWPLNSTGGESCWRWGKERSAEKTEGNSTEHLFAAQTRSGEWRIFEKYRKETVKAKTIWAENKHITEQGTVELGRIGLGEMFPFPKPLGLLEDVISVPASEDALILDSFAGSGTTAHAVLAANARDGGSRRFILVEGEDYADTLTAERVRRVIKGYKYTGTQTTELLREKLTWRTLEKPEALVHKIDGIENLDKHSFDKITKQVRDAELIVTGEKTVAKRAEGLGGSFTYCTLGAAIDMDGLLTGKNLPTVKAMAALLFHTATAKPLDAKSLKAMADIGEGVFRLGDGMGRQLWLIYQPDLAWLKSAAAALTLSRARAIAATAPGDHLVFAPAKFVSRELLAAEKLPVEYAPLPFALYRVETA